VLIYQKRWVKLDAVYLKYFDNDKVRRDAPTYANTLPSSIQYVLWQQLQYIVCSMVVCSQSIHPSILFCLSKVGLRG
ncbi:unnamed protein product, partial [Tetraodon nigroviridis]